MAVQSAKGREALSEMATPRGGGDLHLTLPGPVYAAPTLDPALVRDNATMVIVRQLFRGLLAFDAELTLRPALAASVTAGADARAFEVRLRDDAAFHDGRPIRAGDVAASFVRALDPATAAGDRSLLAASGQLAGIEGADAVLAGKATHLAGLVIHDDRRFTITLADPDAAFPQKLASVAASVVDTSTPEASAANGSGPFRLENPSSSENLTITTTLAPDKRPGTVTSLSFLLGPSAANGGNLLQGGVVDIAPGLGADQAALISDPAVGGAFTVTAVPEFSLLYLAMGPFTPPLDDIHIRRAIQLGFPWKRLAAAAGAGVRPARGVIAPGMLDREWDADLPPYDVDLARREVARSRYGSAERVPPITVYTGQTALSDPLRNIGVALQEELGPRLGLRIEPVSVAWDDFLAGLPAGRFPTYALTWVADFPDPSAFLQVLFASDSPDNYSGYRSAAFDALIAEALATPEPEARAERYSSAQQMLIDDAAIVPVSFDIGYTAFRTGIVGVPASPIGLLGLESVSGA